MDLLDNQEHYTNNKIQPIEIMRENFTLAEYEGFLKGAGRMRKVKFIHFRVNRLISTDFAWR